MDKSNWVRTARIKQGLKGFQLADKLGVSAARISVLEKDETRGAVTLKMMQRVADAMGCKFEYRITPLAKQPVETLADNQDTVLNDKPVVSSKNGKPRYRVV